MGAVKEVRKLFEPINIGSMQLKNRIVFGPMVVNMATTQGYGTGELKDYHVNITRGGAALNTIESSSISPEGKRL